MQGLFPTSPDLAHLKDLWNDGYLTRVAVRSHGRSHPCGTEPPRQWLCICCPLASLLPLLVSALQGMAQLEVEQRGSEAEGFGKGRRIPLRFGEAVARMARGDASLYLTTQAVGTEPDGHPALYASPVAQLAGDVPLVPAVMGPLVPQSISLWMGAARHGARRRGPGARACRRAGGRHTQRLPQPGLLSLRAASGLLQAPAPACELHVHVVEAGGSAAQGRVRPAC